MSKLVKFVVFPIGGIVMILLAAVAYIAATFDPNQYKPQVIKAVKDKTQRTLRLDGDIKMSFFPNIGATLGKISLSERGNEKEFAGIENFRVSLKLIPLFSRQAIVDAVEIKGLRAHLVRYKNGKTNIDDLAGADKATKEKDVRSPVSLDIDHIALENASIELTDEVAGNKLVLTKVDVKTGRLANGVAGKVDVSAHVQSARPKLDVDTTLKTTLMFDTDKQHYTLEGLDFTVRGNAVDVTDLAASVKGDIDAKPQAKELKVSKLVASATGKRQGGDLNIKLDAPTLVVDSSKVSGKNLIFDARVNDVKSKLTAKLEIPSIDGNAKAFTAKELVVTAETEGGGSTIKARVTSPITGSVEAERADLAQINITVNVDNPKAPKNPLNATIVGSAQFDAKNKTANLSFSTNLDESAIKGKVGLAGFTPPAYTFNIDIDKLDADRYMAKGDPKQKKPEEPIDLSALKGLNASGSLRAGSLKVANVQASNVRLDLKAANDRVEISPLSANLYQGTLSGSVAAQAAATPVFWIKQNLAGVDLTQLLKDAANFDTLEGKGNVSLDVTTRGNTTTALKKALDGKAALKLNNGAIKGINIADTIKGARAKLASLKGEQSHAANKNERTEFTELSATFNIANGVAHNNDLTAKTPLLRLAGEGDVDIGNDRLNYLLKPTVVATLSGQGGKELSQLNGLTVPVRLVGPYAALDYKIDFGGMAMSLAKASVENKAQEVKTRFEDQAGSKLKGLLRR